MSTQEFVPTKDTEFEMAVELPPIPPATWTPMTGMTGMYDISGMPLMRAMQDTTTLNSSRFRENTKLLYDVIEITFSMFYTPGEYTALQDILDEEPGERWIKLLFGDGSNFIFGAGINGLNVVSGPVDDVIRVEGTMTVSGDVTYSTT